MQPASMSLHPRLCNKAPHNDANAITKYCITLTVHYLTASPYNKRLNENICCIASIHIASADGMVPKHNVISAAAMSRSKHRKVEVKPNKLKSLFNGYAVLWKLKLLPPRSPF